MTNPQTTKRELRKPHLDLAKDIVSYTLSANAAHIPENDIEKIIAGYLYQMELAVRGAMKIENMPRLHPLQIRDFMEGKI